MSALRRLVRASLPFADAGTAELPLARLLRLSLFQVSVGMALVLLNGTLNRVMVIELGLPSSLVALSLALPLVLAPFRAIVGFRSDNHRSVIGWRRVPYVWMGTLMQFGGFALMPFGLLVLGTGNPATATLGHLGLALSFILAGAGLHMVQTAGLALATDLAPAEARPRVVALLYAMLLVGMVASGVLFGWILTPFTSGAADPRRAWRRARDLSPQYDRRLAAGDPDGAGAGRAGADPDAAPVLAEPWRRGGKLGRPFTVLALGTRRLRHAGRHPRAVRRAGVRAQRGRHDAADRVDGGRHLRRLRPGLAPAAPRRRPASALGRGPLRRPARRRGAGLRRGDACHEPSSASARSRSASPAACSRSAR